MEIELWKDIPGYGGTYQVSAYGKVRRVRKTLTRPLKPSANGKAGYLFVVLSSNGVTTHKFVHRLILESFIGPCPDGHEGAHENGNKTDNRLDNISWKTRRANADDRVKHGKLPKGESHHRSKLCAGDIPRIRDMRACGMGACGMGATVIGGWFNVSASTISDIFAARSWAHIT